MATSNEMGQAAYKEANPQVNSGVLQAAEQSEKAAQPVAAPAQPEENPKAITAPKTIDDSTTTLSDAMSQTPETSSAGSTLTQRISMLGKTGGLEYPEYRTLSQQQRVAYLEAMTNPEYQRLARQTFQEDIEKTSSTAKQTKNTLTRWAADLLSFDNTEMWLGNMVATDDYADVAEMGLNVAAGAAGVAATAAVGILTPSEIAADDYDVLMQDRRKFAAKTKEDIIKEAKDMYASWPDSEKGKKTEESFIDQRLATWEKEKQSLALFDKQQEEERNKPKELTIGQKMVGAALRDIEYKNAVLPQGLPADAETIYNRVLGGATSFGEYMAGAVAGRAIGKVGANISTKTRTTTAGAQRFKNITGKDTKLKTGLVAPSVAAKERYAGMIGGQVGSKAATTLMVNDVLGSGAHESIRQYIEETGDTTLENYTGDIKKFSIDVANAAVQSWIENKWGISKFIKNPRLATKYGEWVNGLIQEFSQGEIGDIAEIIKGNKTLQEALENIGNNAIDGGVGALLQGTVGTAYYMHYHKKTVSELRDIVMKQNPNISFAQAEEFAERKANELEEGVVKDIVKDIVEFTDTNNYQGRIYETVRKNITTAIDAQRAAMKDTIDGSKFDEMTEQERATYISQVAADQTDRIVVQALDEGIALSDVPQLKGETVDGTYYIEGADYAKRTAAQLEAERQQLRDIVFAKKQADKEAKAAATEARKAATYAEKTANMIADAREKAEAARVKKETAQQIKESDARIKELQAEETKWQKQVEKWEKEYAKTQTKSEEAIQKDLERRTKANIKGGNIEIITQILKDEGYRTRDLTGTAIKQLARLNWEKFIDKNLGTSESRGAIYATKAAIEANVESGRDVLLRAGMTTEQIDKLDDNTFNQLVIAAYREENAEQIARDEKQQRETEEAIAQLDIDDIPFQDVYLQDEYFDVAEENARLDAENKPYDGETIRIIDPVELKQAQFEIVQETNPMQDDYHVGIRSVDDIKTFAETINDEESFVWGDYSREDAQRDLAKNKITVYSSKPIENGVFVSTSYRQAQEYAGGKGKKVYERTVPLDFVAWINGDEGQFAMTDVVGKKRPTKNSDGQPIAKSEPALRNFWNWFGDSKVVDEQGRPLVVYHGTKEEFDTFDIKQVGSNTGNFGHIGFGFYFTQDQDYAQSYGANVMPVYLKSTNVFTGTKEQIKSVAKELDESPYTEFGDGKQLKRITDFTSIYTFGDSSVDFTNAVKKLGYDSVFDGDEYVVFESNQIKSTENRGTFSPDTGNIYFQKAYAGSRVDYDKPSLEALGTGEGNQAHGWGLYYALDPQIAEKYRETFIADEKRGSNNYFYNGKPMPETKYKDIDGLTLKHLTDTGKNATERWITARIKDIEDLLSTAKRSEHSEEWFVEGNADIQAYKKTLSLLEDMNVDLLKYIEPKGQVHEVDIPEMDVLLDEQKTFDEQSDFVKSALDSIDIKNYPNFANAILNGKTGKDIYNSLIIDIDAINERNDVANAKPDKQASQLLEQYGIKGITYWGKEDGRCFVIFNENSVKVLRKKFDELGNVLFQNRQRGKGGAYDARTRSITLGAKADATTLPHELAHYWIDKNFKYARSGRASQAWLNSWQQVEKYLNIDPEDKVLDKAASEKFARAYERFLAEEKLPLRIVKSVADFRDFVLDHYDFDLDEARGLQDKFGRPIQMTDEIRQWFNKALYDNYVDPSEALTIDVRVEQENEKIKIAQRVEDHFDDVQAEANTPDTKANNIIKEMPSGNEIQQSAGIENKRIIGGGAIKESQGAIGQQIGATYESTSWELQENMVDEYLKTVSLDEAIESLDDDTYPDKIDADFLRARLIEKLNEEGREDEAARLVMETRENLTEAAQTLQAARRLNTPYVAAINQIVQQKAEKLARAKFGNGKKAMSKLEAAIERIIDKYEPMYLDAKDDTERAIVYDTMMNEAARTIGTLNKNAEILFQDDKRQDAKMMKQLRKRGSVKAYRSRAKALLKQKLGLAPTREQLRQISRLTSEVNKVIAKYRADVREGKKPVIDPSEVLKAQNELNNYMTAQVGSSKMAQFADATNSFMMANMLWNPATQFKNIVGNTMQMIPHLLGSVAKYRNIGTIQMAEKMKIIGNALKIQATTGYNVYSLTDFFDRKTLWAEKYYEPTTIIGKGIRAPLTLLGLSDTVFKGFVFLNHADIMATHMAQNEGKENNWSKEQIEKRAKELFYQALNTDPRTITLAGQKIRSEALVEGEEATFTQDSKTAQFANQFRNILNFGKKTGVGNLLIPFTSTVANIAQDAVANWSLGTVKEAIKNPRALFDAINPMIDKESRKAAWKTIAPEYKNLIKNVLGILLMVYIAATMGDDDDFVLDYNLQTELDKDIRQNRNAPYGTAVRIGDKWVQIDFLSGAYLPLQTYLTARRHNFTTDGWLQGLFGWRDLMPGVGEMESLLKDYQNSLKYNKDSESAAVGELLTDQGTEILTRLIPMGALANQIGNITDETKREKYNRWYDRILGRLPWAREILPESTSRATGKAIPQTDNWWNMLTGGNVKDYVEAGVSDLARYEFIDADKALRFNEASSRLKELGKDTQRYKDAVREVRMIYNQKLAQLAQHPTYKKWDIEKKRKAAVDLHTDVVNAVATKYGIKKKKPLKKKQKQPKLV